MYCSNCGKKINENEKNCPYCKTVIQDEAMYQEEVKNEIKEDKERKEKEENPPERIKIEFNISFILLVSTVLFPVLSLLIEKSNTQLTLCYIGFLSFLIGSFCLLDVRIHRYKLIPTILLESLYSFAFAFYFIAMGIHLLKSCSG